MTEPEPTAKFLEIIQKVKSWENITNWVLLTGSIGILGLIILTKLAQWW